MKNIKKPLLILSISLCLTTLFGCNSSNNTSNESKTSRNRASRGDSSLETKEFNISYDLNYEGAPNVETVKVSEEDFVADKNATRDGYAFIGWATSKDGAELYNFNDKPKNDLTLYAKWAPEGFKKFVFEAEYCSCLLNGGKDGGPMKGYTFNADKTGQDLIQEDYDSQANASNGFYVHYLYEEGNYLLWEIESDAAVDDAQIYMRFSGELQESTFSISKDVYPVYVNDVSIDYGTITFTNVPIYGFPVMKFHDYVLSTKISLKAGVNTIRMVTDNENRHIASAGALAPQQDCIKIYSKSNLTWPTAAMDNLAFFNK